MKPNHKEIEHQLLESRREFWAADATINNLELKLEEMAAQLANAENKCAAPVSVPAERAAFETFMEKRFKDLIDRRLVKNGDGEYFAWDMQVAWIVWQGRAAMLQGAEPEGHAYALPANSFSNKELEGMAHGDNPQANAYRELLAFRLNSPVTPDGWQLVPKEPTEAMNKAGWAAINEHDEINPTYRAMLVAAPQHEVNK